MFNPVLLSAGLNAFASAGIDSSAWRRGLEDISTATESTGCVLLAIKGNVPGVPHTTSLSGLVEDYFGKGWTTREFRARGIPALRRKGVIVDQDFVSPSQMKKEAYYQEFMRSHGVQWFAGISFSVEGDVWMACLQRSEQQGPFSKQEQAALEELRPGLSASAAISRAIGTARLDGLLAGFDIMKQGVVFVDRYGKVVLLNQDAEKISADTLGIVDSALQLKFTPSDRALSRAIFIAANARSEEQHEATSTLYLTRAIGRPIIATVSPIPFPVQDCFAPARVMILLSDPDSKPRSPSDQLKAYFSLTDSEAEFAYGLALGNSPEALAVQLGYTVGSARQITKKVLVKTDTHRQSEFVALAAKVLGVPFIG